MSSVTGIAQAPAYKADRWALASRTVYSFSDYGFEISSRVTDVFEVVPSRVTEEECFLFFFVRDDVTSGRWALFNLHVFLKRIGPTEAFARSLGESVKTQALTPVVAFGMLGIGYTRTIAMKDLFKGGEPVITLIGGQPDWMVRDSHFYFQHRHTHCYSGLLHFPGDEARYDSLRGILFEGLRFID